ncbi:hypothetical protein SteCoe_31203 [Stentor coeruleus]|uniref:Dicer-like protein05 n=1 Tax=Stentor coeruleus TaxID=5963 RepID=A0A060BQZ0_9CILI|nr:dicer-like protein05 [Stentor coeruleus]OMJ70754.1 hypothetical protein SteCoe_31203 [Stentor coeruleus]
MEIKADSEDDPTKKAKIVDKNNYFEIKNYSPILEQPFTLVANGVKVYTYNFSEIPGFCILFPMNYIPLPPILKEVGVRIMNLKELEYLKAFQNIMWSDLFQTPYNESGEQSYANYLIAPTCKKNISWLSIKAALGMKKDLKSSQKQSLDKLVYHIPPKKQKYYYAMKIKKNTQPSDIICKISKKSLYSQEVPDTIQQETINKATKILKNASFIYPHYEYPLVLLRLVRVVRKKELKDKKPNKPITLKIAPERILETFYLTRKQTRNANKIIKALVTIERYTYIIDFVNRYNYHGDFNLIRDATTAPAYDNDRNYDPIENLGDSILKVISSLQLYFRHTGKNEGFLTDMRTSFVKNKALCKVNLNNELYFYMRSAKVRQKCFRPAYYTGLKRPSEVIVLNEKFSDGMLADEIESLIGAFYLSSGFIGAAGFINRVKVLPEEEWDKTIGFLDKTYKGMLGDKDMKDFNLNNFDDLIPRPEKFILASTSDYSTLEKILNYKFKNQRIIDEAFTHGSLGLGYNYERLEFLGDAVVDTIVITNVFPLGKFTAERLTVFRHMLVNNVVLSRLSISLGLQNYLKAVKEVYEEIRRYFADFQWEEDLLDFGVYNSHPPKCLNDIFESLIGAVLLDSESLDLTCKIFTPFMKNLILHLAQNEERCDMNIRSKLSTYCQKKHIKCETKTRLDKGLVIAEVYVSNDFICDATGHTSWLAKQIVSQKAYILLTSSK